MTKKHAPLIHRKLKLIPTVEPLHKYSTKSKKNGAEYAKV